VGGFWRMDETYVKVRGELVYLYRAVDKAGKPADFFLSRQRDINAVKAFLRKAIVDALGEDRGNGGGSEWLVDEHRSPAISRMPSKES
jgi:transposase-like protein